MGCSQVLAPSHACRFFLDSVSAGTKERQIACLTAYINPGIGHVGWKWSAYPDAFSLCPVRCPHRDDIEVSERLFYRGALFVYRQEGH